MKKMIYKLFFIVMLAGTSLSGISQNVGIGTTEPTEKLDVNGNVNITGNLKTGGVAGLPGQVLMINGAGATQWGTLPSPGEEYKNFVCFNLGSGTWNVPEGVTKILIEAWGAGGGGSAYGGGAGGGYVRSWISVTPGTPITYTVGAGGARGSGSGASANGQPGGNTTVSIVGGDRIAYGGDGATTTSNHLFFSVHIGGSYYGGNNQSIGFAGESGYQNDISYIEKSPGVFLQTIRGGKGGDGANTFNTGGRGSFANLISASSSEGLNSGPSTGRIPGGGGGGGIATNSTGVFWDGSNGGNGRVIIWY